MMGNIDFIIYNVSKKHPELKREFIEDLYYGYWESVRKHMQYSDKPCINLSKFGFLYTKNNKLRSFIRSLIAELKYFKRERNNPLKSEEFRIGYNKRYEAGCIRFKAAWGQLEELRKVIIQKTNKRKVWREYYDKLNAENEQTK